MNRSLDDEISKPGLKINVVIKIGDTYFARYKPDLDLEIEDKYLIVDKVNFAKAVLDLRDIKTSIPTDSFTLIDEDYVATEFLFTPENRYLNTEVIMWIGISDKGFPWGEYLLVSRAIIKEITRNVNGYNISLRRNVELTSRPLWYVFDSLAKDISEFDTVIPLVNSIYFPATGMIRIDEEVISYTGNNTSTGILSGLSRGLFGSTNASTKVSVRADVSNNLDGKYFLINTPTQGYAIWYKTVAGTAPGAYPFNIQVNIATNAAANAVATATMNAINASTAFTATSGGEQIIITSIPPGNTVPSQDFNTGFRFEMVNLSIKEHRKGEDVFSIKTLDENPITAMLKFMMSGGGGGVYDVLEYGLGIDPALIDIEGIEAIRDTFYPTEVYRFFVTKISSAHEFFEKEICLPTNTRLTNKNGQITLVYIDQSTVYDYLIDETTIIGIPDWAVSVDKLVNRILINFDYNVGLDTYGKTSLYENATSISSYGKKEIIYSFKGIQSALNGQAIVNDLGQKLLIRLKDPRTKITTNTFFSNMNIELGSTVKLRHRYVPGDKVMGIDTDMTVLEKGIDFSKGTVSLGLYYTSISSSGIKRFGVISPAAPIISFASQRVFTLDAKYSAFFDVGYRILIGNESREILLMTGGNIITVNIPFTEILYVGKIVKIVDYDSATQAEKDLYAFTSPNTGTFADGGLHYQIVP